MAPLLSYRRIRLMAPTAILGLGLAYFYSNKNLPKSFSQYFSILTNNNNNNSNDGHSLSTIIENKDNNGKKHAFFDDNKNSTVKRIVSVGDLHGDLSQMQKVFQLMGLTNKSNKWSGGTTHFVQTGDIGNKSNKT